LTDLSVGAFRSLFQIMAARGVGVCFQRASAIQIANPMRQVCEDHEERTDRNNAPMIGDRPYRNDLADPICVIL
jgi:hypothetical protein